MVDKVAFTALIKEVSTKSLVSGDKETRLTLQFKPTDEILDGLNRLHRGDAMVMAAFVAMSGNVENHAIQKGKQIKHRTAQRGEV
jgi:hypothetical protein